MTFWSARSGRPRLGAAVLALLSPLALHAQRQTGELMGRVLSGDVAVPGAAIYVSGGRVTLARVDGRFRLSLPAGRYEVRARRIGYVAARDSVTIQPSGPTTVQFKLERTPSPLEAVATLGSRTLERSVIDALEPVDVIDGATLRATGRVRTSEALQAAAASVNVSHATVGQQTDLIHPFSMRGFSPDQVLVLVNGKRRHSSAAVNLAGSPGRGSSGVDLDAIPASMIERIEVMHGDAVAEYGADAIGGVVNVILKSGVHGAATAGGGNTVTTWNRDQSPVDVPYFGTPSARDGRTVQASIDKGVVWGERGFLHGGMELRDRGATNRNLRDPNVATYADDAWGDPHTHDGALYLNGGNLFANGVEAYGNLGGSRRTIGAPTPTVSLSSGTFVPAVDATSGDYAGTLGLRGQGDDWHWDLSTVYGWNTLSLGLSPAVNRALAAPAIASLDAGAQRFAQSATALELTRDLPYFEETRLELGAEVRRDAYRTTTGESASYSGDPAVASSWYGIAAIAPAQAVDRSRIATSAHADLETDLTGTLQAGASGRVEHYADVGTQVAGKLNLRYEPARRLVFRGSVARGYRAPTLQQSSLSLLWPDMSVTGVTTLSQLVPTVGLRAEHSLDLQAGMAVEVTDALSLTIDGYRTAIQDRIGLAGVLYALNGVPFGFAFENDADTRTEGLDATATYGLRFDDGASLKLAAGANVNHTRVTSASAFPDALWVFGATPRDNLIGSATFALRDLGAMLRTQRYGSVQTGSMGQSYPARWVTDANVSYTLGRKYTFTAGADNLFDVYPARPSPQSTAPQRFNSYDASSPFGFNGRYVFGRLSIYL